MNNMRASWIVSGLAIVVAAVALVVAAIAISSRNTSSTGEHPLLASKSAPAEYTVAFVEKALRRYDAEGRDATIAFYKSQESVDGAWYIFIMDENDVTIAHPRPELLGRTREQRVDITGHNYGAEFATATGDGKWVSYVFLNPTTGNQETKHTWLIRHDGLIFASGWYE